ncbi:MAG: putative quinol monooxygenase [Maricaulaceae bacterium]
MKFIIYAEIDVQDEKRSALLEALFPLIEKIRAQTGCVNYDWNMDSSNEGRINVYEEWEDEAALTAHFAGDNFKAMGAKISEHGILGAKARKFSINQEGSVFNASGTPSVKF